MEVLVIIFVICVRDWPWARDIIQALLKLWLEQETHPGLHGAPQHLGAGDPLQAAHVLEAQFGVHELCHALV